MSKYAIVNLEILEKEIENLKENLKISESLRDNIRAGIETYEIKKLEWVLSQSTPLIPEIEKALYAKGAWYEDEIQDYISNLKLDI